MACYKHANNGSALIWQPRTEHSLLKGTLIYVMLRSGVSLLSLFALLFIVRLLGPAETGKVTLAIVLIQGIAPLVAFGTDSALARYGVNAGREEFLFLYRRAILFLSAGLLLSTGILIGSNASHLLPAELAAVLLPMSGLVACYGLTFVNQFTLRGLGKLNISSLLEGANEAVPRLLALLLFILTRASYVTYLYVQLGVALAVMLFSCALVYHYAGQIASRAETSDYPSITGYWLYSSMFLLSNVILLFNNTLSPWMLRYFLSPVAVGLYALATRIPTTIINLTLPPLHVPLLYYFSAEEHRTDTRAFIQGVTLLSALLGSCCLGLAGTASWLVPHIFGRAFSEAIPAFMIYAHVPFIIAIYAFLNPLLASQNRIQISNLSIILTVLVLALLNSVLIPTLSVTGACIAVVIALVLVTPIFISWSNTTVPGLLSRVLILYMLYAPFALVATLHYGVVAALGFPALLLLLRLIDRAYLTTLIRSEWSRMEKALSRTE